MPTAIITGAGGNLGKAVADLLIDHDYRVIGTVSKLPATPSQPEAKQEWHAVDLADDAKVASLVAELIQGGEGIDLLVCAAGGYAGGSLADTNVADLEAQYRQNFLTAYNIAAPVFRHMLQRGTGHIFLIGSKPGLSASYGKEAIAYGLAKSLLFRLAELMNLEAKGTSVVVSVIVPGTIDTPQNREAMGDANADKWVKPEDIAAAIHFHASPSAAAIREPVIKIYNQS